MNETVTVGDYLSLAQMMGSRWRRWGSSESDMPAVVVGINGEGKGAGVVLAYSEEDSEAILLSQLMAEFIPYFTPTGTSL